MRILLSTTALCLMAAGFYLLFDLGSSVNAAMLFVAPPPTPVAWRAPGQGLRIELVGSERLEAGDLSSATPWVTFEPGASVDCAHLQRTVTLADADGLLGGV